MIYQHPYLILAAFVVLASWALWCRYREGRLLSPATGIHLQILVFFGVGGLAYALFPEAEPYLTKDEILVGSAQACWPLLLGYGIAFFIQHVFLRQPVRAERVMAQAGVFSPVVIFLVALLGFAGCLLEGRLKVSGLSSVPTYFKHLFFPSFLLAIINVRTYDAFGRLVAVLIVLMALIIGVWSPWRSVLIILAATVVLGMLLIKPRWLPVTVLVAVLFMGVLIPFQLAKRVDYEEFRQSPLVTLRKSQQLEITQRWSQIGDFMAQRINYARELVYVVRALEAGLELQSGKTYQGIVYQLVPRMIWPNKPEMAHWAGFDLPREVGLLQEVDEFTSWAVNMFAEATYNFGRWCLVWFVPVAFLLAEAMERLVRRIYRSPSAVVLANVAFFFFFFSVTSVIFAASMTVALLLVVKCVDVTMSFFGLAEQQRVPVKTPQPKSKAVATTRTPNRPQPRGRGA